MTAPNFGYPSALLFDESQLPRIHPAEIEYLLYAGVDAPFTEYAEPYDSDMYRLVNGADVIRTAAWEMN